MKHLNVCYLLAAVNVLGCSVPSIDESLPNVILIMADDMGYECLSTYGSLSYQTPRLDQLAAEGIRFDHCISQPLCTPSRVKIMTGQYNYRNYEYFGYLDTTYQTFGRVMKDAGYATCIVGKWQLNGLAYKEQIPSWSDASKPHQMGFDEYCLWQLTQTRSKGERFANPLIEQNGALLPRDSNAYGPDVFANYLLDFIDRKKDERFFAYYPMVLVHEPFVPTPDSEAWADGSRRYEKDTAYFKEMVAYSDKIVGRIVDRLAKHGLIDNTLLIFTGDNGTDRHIVTRTRQGTIVGGKGTTTDAGTRVPLIAHWPQGGQQGIVYEPLIEFSDFYATLSELVGGPTDGDGRSFLSILQGKDHTPRSSAFVHYDPQWGNYVNQFRNQFVRTVRYKLYDSGEFFDLKMDPQELSPIDTADIDGEARSAYELLNEERQVHPPFSY